MPHKRTARGGVPGNLSLLFLVIADELGNSLPRHVVDAGARVDPGGMAPMWLLHVRAAGPDEKGVRLSR